MNLCKKCLLLTGVALLSISGGNNKYSNTFENNSLTAKTGTISSSLSGFFPGHGFELPELNKNKFYYLVGSNSKYIENDLIARTKVTIYHQSQNNFEKLLSFITQRDFYFITYDDIKKIENDSSSTLIVQK